MSGLVKPKKYDWKDSNLALFGSKTEKKIKKESAQAEPAWQGAGQKVGLKIWRIVKFKVEDWPEADYGKFYSGDSYIILNTYHPDPSSKEIAYDVHFWIGKGSTQDEYGTAAYKTVELDHLLDDVPVQHREVQDNESEMFKDYFKSITIMKGGAASGFRHVKPEEYKPRLLHFSGKARHITVKEVALMRSKLNSGDVFILDLGQTLYQWNGTGSNKDERFKAMQFLSNLKSERSGAKSFTIEEQGLEDDHPFYKALTDDEDDDADDDVVDSAPGTDALYKVSDASGQLEFTKKKEGSISKSDLCTKDVFVLDTGKMCFVWVGKGSSDDEKINGFAYAHKHLQSTKHPLVPICIVKEGQKNADFETAIAA